MNYPIPSWIQPADEVGNFSRGLSQGASIGEAQARQAQAAAEMAQRQQDQQAKMAEDALMRQTEAQTQAEYKRLQRELDAKRISETAVRDQETARHNLATEGNPRVAAEQWALKQQRDKYIAEHAPIDGQLKASQDAYIKYGGVTSGMIEQWARTGNQGDPSIMKPGTAYQIFNNLSKKTERTPLENQELEAARTVVHKGLGVSTDPIPNDYRPGQMSGGVSAPAGPMPVGPSMAPPPMAPAPAAPTAPQFSAPPPKEKRQKDQTYQTPKGPYTWTGDGWKAYEAPSHDEVPSDLAPATPADEEPTDEEQ